MSVIKRGITMAMVLRDAFNPNLFKGAAHRGLHNKEFTENGLNAFKNAIDHDFCFELDIHLTTDNELIVCHDSNLVRTTGKEGIIEDLDSKTIRNNYRLLDGEVVPTLQEVLDLNKERETIVVELKVYKGNYKALAKRALEVLKQVKDSKSITLISFDPRALIECKHCPFTRGFLVGQPRSYFLMLRPLFEYLDVEDTLLDDHRIIKYREKGGIINAWTIRSKDQLEKTKGKCDLVTFENIDISLLENK